MLKSVSTLFVLVRFDTGEGIMRVIIEAPQPLVLSFFGEDTEHYGTIIFCWVFGESICAGCVCRCGQSPCSY